MIIIQKNWCALCIALLSVTIATPAHADTVNVAVASNFLKPVEAIRQLFEKNTAHKVIISSGSTGQLYTQITQGAPYDVFLAADQKRPALLSKSGLAVNQSQYTYAYGKLALYSSHSTEKISEASLGHMDYQRLAIANPNTAPYGAAAVQVLKKLNLLTQLRPRLVRGANIAQTYQFVETGNAGLGLIALAQVIDKPDDMVWRIPQGYYQPIAQDLVLLKPNHLNLAAEEFLEHIKSSEVKLLIKKYGYDVDLQAK